MYEFIFAQNDKTNKKFIRKSYEVKRHLNITALHTLFEAVYDSGYSFVGESHNFWECVYITDGNATVTSNDKIYHLEANDMIFHKPFEFHNLQIENSENARVFIFSFTESGEFMKYFENKVFKLSKMQKSTVEMLNEYLNSKYSQINSAKESTVKNYMECYNSFSAFSNTVISYIELLFLQLRDNAGLLVLSNVTSPGAELFKEAVNFMNANITSNLSVNQIAKYCHTSTTGLKQVFYDYAGLGVHKYFLHLKISAATRLLENGEPVGSVAESLGFSSPGYFSSVYKRETGYSPSQINPKA